MFQKSMHEGKAIKVWLVLGAYFVEDTKPMNSYVDDVEIELNNRRREVNKSLLYKCQFYLPLFLARVYVHRCLLLLN